MGNSKIAEEEAIFIAEKQGKNIEAVRRRMEARRENRSALKSLIHS